MGGVTADGPDERFARLRLARLTEPGDKAVGALVARQGAIGLLARIEGGDTSLPNVAHYRARIGLEPDVDLERLTSAGGRFVIPGDSEWPTQLDDLAEAAPLGLFIRGTSLRQAALRSVAIVGSRAATDYGNLVAGDMAHDLGVTNWVVVSGGAVGIDAAAHRGSLVAGATTVTVLACGVDVCYPRSNTTLFERIVAEGGCIVSELPPQSHPTKPRFLQRNRVIAAVSRGTVVVEAAHRSGALSTATHCRALGRTLMAVPGPVTSAMSTGSHRLLRDDNPARLVTTAEEVVEEVGAIGELAALPTCPTTIRDGLDPTSLRVLEAVAVARTLTSRQVAEGAGLDHGVVAGVLLRLTAAGLVLADRKPDGNEGYRLAWGEADRSQQGGAGRADDLASSCGGVTCQSLSGRPPWTGESERSSDSSSYGSSVSRGGRRAVPGRVCARIGAVRAAPTCRAGARLAHSSRVPRRC